MGDRGRLVIPAALRERWGLIAGRPVVLVDTPRGILLATREEARSILRASLDGTDLVAELLADRRRAAAVEDE
jgi:bifunctional DNA-binding transcriptional regulator/antitoxin component of YhaV-PrlF toxin-antitoxin module